jgi:hypothetical protein
LGSKQQKYPIGIAEQHSGRSASVNLNELTLLLRSEECLDDRVRRVKGIERRRLWLAFSTGSNDNQELAQLRRSLHRRTVEAVH